GRGGGAGRAAVEEARRRGRLHRAFADLAHTEREGPVGRCAEGRGARLVARERHADRRRAAGAIAAVAREEEAGRGRGREAHGGAVGEGGRAFVAAEDALGHAGDAAAAGAFDEEAARNRRGGGGGAERV